MFVPPGVVGTCEGVTGVVDLPNMTPAPLPALPRGLSPAHSPAPVGVWLLLLRLYRPVGVYTDSGLCCCCCRCW